MTATVSAASLLRLPRSAAGTSVTLPPNGLRSYLEQLAERRFSGRAELRADEWLSEVLAKDGVPLAAALGGPGLERPLEGQQALAGLVGQAAPAWSCGLEALEGPPLAALVGLGATASVCQAGTAGELRSLLRSLVESNQDGVVEVSAGSRWARGLLGAGSILGAYSDLNPYLTPTLAPLGEVLAELSPMVRWFPAREAGPLPVPTTPSALGVVLRTCAAEVERQIVWIVSRFEGAWGRARERGAPPEELQVALLEMLCSLESLAGSLENNRGDEAALEIALADFAVNGRASQSDSAAEHGVEGLPARQACPLLADLVAQALDRVVEACPEQTLADCCRLAGVALDAELRAAFPGSVGTDRAQGAGAR